MDAVEKLLQDAPKEIQAVHEEVRLLRDLVLANNREIKAEIKEGFEGVAKRCAATYGSVRFRPAG